MALEIRFADRLTDEERKILFEWGENIFGEDDAKYRWRPKDYHFVTEEDGRVISHVGVLKTTVRAGGIDLTVGGVGGVVTVPEANQGDIMGDLNSKRGRITTPGTGCRR